MATFITYEEERFGHQFFDDVKQFITIYCEIDDVYSDDAIESWLKEDGFVQDHLDIPDVFDEKYIKMWLEENAKDYGYVMEEG